MQDRPKLLLITKKTWLSNDMKITDLGWPWRAIMHYAMPIVWYCG